MMGLEISDEDSQLGSVSHMYSVCGEVGLRGRTLALRAARLFCCRNASGLSCVGYLGEGVAPEESSRTRASQLKESIPRSVRLTLRLTLRL